VEETLDSVGWWFGGSRTDVDRTINDAVTAITQDAYEFEVAVVDDSTNGRRTREIVGRHLAGQSEKACGK